MARYLVAHNVVSIYEDQEDWIRDWSGLRQRAKADARWTSKFIWFSRIVRIVSRRLAAMRSSAV